MTRKLKKETVHVVLEKYMRLFHCSQHGVCCSKIVVNFRKPNFPALRSAWRPYVLSVLTLKCSGFCSQYVVVFPLILEINSDYFPK